MSVCTSTEPKKKRNPQTKNESSKPKAKLTHRRYTFKTWNTKEALNKLNRSICFQISNNDLRRS